ncbi:putative six-bladed beta-propeller, TolB [Helianthus annuus]|nr:putative six-bladed beta-propeller, TolB [Helianthus annuus]
MGIIFFFSLRMVGYLLKQLWKEISWGLCLISFECLTHDDAQLYAVDSVNSNIARITPNPRCDDKTIAGGKSSVAGYRDGPSKDAQFSTDFDVIYVRPTSSLLVVDR